MIVAAVRVSAAARVEIAWRRFGWFLADWRSPEWLAELSGPYGKANLPHPRVSRLRSLAADSRFPLISLNVAPGQILSGRATRSNTVAICGYLLKQTARLAAQAGQRCALELAGLPSLHSGLCQHQIIMHLAQQDSHLDQ